MSDALLLSQREDRVLVLTLNRPDTLNALTPALFEALHESLRAAKEDSSVGAIVITGAGRGFCSGGDRKNKAAELARDAALPVELRTRPQSFEASVAEVRRWANTIELLQEMSKPSIAMINGACAGAGLSLAGACDLRFSARSAVFSSAFVHAGLSGDFGGSWLWTRILGVAKARELYLLGEKMSAAEALTFGLVNRLFDDEQLLEETMKVAHTLAGRPSHTFGYMKANLNAAPELSLSRLLDLETRNMILSNRSWLRDEVRLPPSSPGADQS